MDKHSDPRGVLHAFLRSDAASRRVHLHVAARGGGLWLVQLRRSRRRAVGRPAGVPGRRWSGGAPSVSVLTASRCRRRRPPRLACGPAPRDALPRQPRAHERRPVRPCAPSVTSARAASRHAADMGRRHYFAHVSPSGTSALSRARAAGWRGGVGEVIAWGCGGCSTPRATVRAWLPSPRHRVDRPGLRSRGRRRRQAAQGAAAAATTG